MNNKIIRVVAVSALVLGLLTFLLTIGDFLALHDIGNDYVSKDCLAYLNISLSKELPAWTETSGEWRLVEISWITRSGFFILNTATLILCILALRERRGQLDVPCETTTLMGPSCPK